MWGFESLGRMLLLIGVTLVLLGGVLLLVGKVPFLGRLPGDIVVKRDRFTFYFPLTTCIIVSLILTLFLKLFGPK